MLTKQKLLTSAKQKLSTMSTYIISEKNKQNKTNKQTNNNKKTQTNKKQPQPTNQRNKQNQKRKGAKRKLTVLCAVLSEQK